MKKETDANDPNLFSNADNAQDEDSIMNLDSHNARELDDEEKIALRGRSSTGYPRGRPKGKRGGQRG